MIIRVFVYSRMWNAVSVGIVLQKNRTEPSTEIWGLKPIETDRKRKIPHRNNTICRPCLADVFQASSACNPYN